MLRKFLLLCLFAGAYSATAFAAPEQWIEVRTGHFILNTNAGDRDARTLGDQFERMRWMFGVLFPKAELDPVEPLVVVAVRNRKQFEAIEPADYLGKGKLQLAGLFGNSSDRDYILLRLDSEDTEHPFSTVFHEYTHLQFRYAARWMPIWLNEGEAQFMENTTFQQKNVHLGQASANMIYFLREQKLIPLPVLFAVDHSSPYYHEENKGSVFYAESWALTHYLMVTGRETNKNLIGDYMVRMSRKEDPVTAAQEVFGDLKKLQANLEGYIHNSGYKEFVLNSSAAQIDESKFAVRPLKQADVDALKADVLAHVGRGEEAATLAHTVQTEDPTNPAPYETFGYIAYRKGDREEARRQYQEAVELHSTNFYAYSVAAARIFRSDDAVAGQQEEEDLRTAIRLNPRYVEPYINLASLLASTDRLDEARKLLANARPIAVNESDQMALRSETAQLENRRSIETAEAVQATRIVGVAGEEQEHPSAGVVTVAAVDAAPPPRHPVEQATGPRHTFDGVVESVDCSYPAVLEMKVAGKGATIDVYTNNYYQLQISAANFTPEGELHPCSDIKGMKASVEFRESTDTTVDGQILSIVLRK